MRAVLDPNVFISALLSRNGAPAQVVSAWLSGSVDLVVSPLLLEELERALDCPKLRSRISQGEAAAFVELLRRLGSVVEDPTDARLVTSPDPEGDYLITFAQRSRAVIVSADADLVNLSPRLPVFSSRSLLDFLASKSE